MKLRDLDKTKKYYLINEILRDFEVEYDGSLREWVAFKVRKPLSKIFRPNVLGKLDFTPFKLSERH